ncbi:hypothetical protein GOP47_0009116 [Adiantum capillus-veneris]|uniref:Copper transport protein n=1 Tax=Adiantum capillus-veneris TaxID=13818 RepID=A0A9D4ZKZ7_ADICA|nr:hypothetical protein GOP47_0009116 [Adiantum capillus-veneris]
MATHEDHDIGAPAAMESPSTTTNTHDTGAATSHHLTSFYWGHQATILFDDWRTTSPGTYVASLLALLLISFLYQYLERLTSPSSPILLPYSSSSSSCCPTTPHNNNNHSKPISPSPHQLPLPTKLLLTLLFSLRVGLAYLLMLAVMSFNGGVFLAVILGLSAGFFVFRTDIHTPKCVPVLSASDANLHP